MFSPQPPSSSAPLLKFMAVFVYIVECADQTLYTGWTTNVERRLKAHNAGRGAKYTQQRGPVHLVYLEEWPDRGAAQRRELEIKRMPRAEKLKLVERSKVEHLTF